MYQRISYTMYSRSLSYAISFVCHFAFYTKLDSVKQFDSQDGIIKIVMLTGGYIMTSWSWLSTAWM